MTLSFIFLQTLLSFLFLVKDFILPFVVFVAIIGKRLLIVVYFRFIGYLRVVHFVCYGRSNRVFMEFIAGKAIRKLNHVI